MAALFMTIGMTLAISWVAHMIKEAREWKRTPVEHRRWSCTIRLVGSGGRYPNDLRCELTIAEHAALLDAMASKRTYTTPGGTTVATDMVTRTWWDGPDTPRLSPFDPTDDRTAAEKREQENP